GLCTLLARERGLDHAGDAERVARAQRAADVLVEPALVDICSGALAERTPGHRAAQLAHEHDAEERLELTRGVLVVALAGRALGTLEALVAAERHVGQPRFLCVSDAHHITR